MLRYIARRLLALIPVVFGVTIVVFLLLRLIPGDPAQAILGARATPETIAKINRELGLDRSLPEQYAMFVSSILRGDLGDSILYGRPALHLIAERLPRSLFLAAYATALAALIAVPLSLAAALRRGSLADHIIRTSVVFGISLPSYWIGVMLLLLFAVIVPLFPVTGYGEGPAALLYYLFLPALTLALGIAPVLVRSLRASLIEALKAGHVNTARAKGMPSSAVLVRHVLRNALIPAVTLLGMHAGWLASGSMIVESVFGVPGLGQLMIRAIGTRDYPTVQATALVFAALVVLVNLATDIVYMLLDPRVRVSDR